MAGAIKNDEVAERLRRLRAALGIETQAEMAGKLRVDFNRYNTAERGQPLSKDLAILICQRFAGVTLDWLFFGNLAGVPYDLVRRIGGAPTASNGRSIRTKTGAEALSDKK